MFKKAVSLFLGLLFFAWALAVWPQEATLRRTISERLITRIDLSSSKKDSIRASPDCRRVAYESEARLMQSVVIDGREGKPYDRVSHVEFSPDSLRVAHLAKTGEKWIVVIDGREGKPYDQVTFPVFSPDSKRLAYMAKGGNQWFAVVDGKEGPAYVYDQFLYLMALINPPKFSPDSRHFAYMGRTGKQFFMVVDGNEGKKYHFVSNPAFSPDGKLAYTAEMEKKKFVVIDGKEEKPYDDVGVPRFSLDGRRLAYDVKVGNRAFVVIDGREEKPYEGINKSPIFSPDGSRLAYGVKSGNRELIVIDGKEEKSYDATDFPRFSPDGKRVAYPAKRGDRWFMVADGGEGKEYGYVHRPNFSPDSRHLAYRTKMGNKVKVVVDGNEGREYDEVFGDYLGDIVFDSPQSLHYLARRGGNLYLVEEEVAGPERKEAVKETEPARRMEGKSPGPRAETVKEREKEGEKVTLAENFNQNRASLFEEAQGETYSLKFIDECFLWFIKGLNRRVWQVGPKDVSDRFVAEVDLWRVEGPRDSGFGLYVKRKESEDAWWAGISSNGYYQVQKRASGKVEDIRKWTLSPYVLGKRHRFKLDVQAGMARLSIDGNLVAEVKDEFIKGGQVGLYAATPEFFFGPEDKGGLKVKFDNFSITYEAEGKKAPAILDKPPASDLSAPSPTIPQPEETKVKKFPKEIDPRQTSEDPTYGYTIENPVKVGGPKGFSGPQSERLYLEHLRNPNFRPLKFSRAGSFGMTQDGHIVDGYELVSEDGKKYFIYMDMYHPEIHPLQVKAPKGLYIWTGN